jgi:cytochrome c-type biogenesis protein CcmH
MAWLIMILAALVVGLGLWLFLRRDPGAVQFLAAALLLALAGYAWQGRPELPGRPKAPPVHLRLPDNAFAQTREDLLGRFDRSWTWMNLADSYQRRGDTAGAAEVLETAVRRNPRDADLWVAYGYALVVHGGDTMNPAAQLAFQRAAAIAPNHPGPPFFFALALAQAGNYDDAERIWRDLLPNVPADSQFHAAIQQRLEALQRARLDGELPAAGGPAGAAPAGR